MAVYQNNVLKEVPIYGSNHLGNVLVTLTDGSANVLSYSDYFPFGAKISDRSWNREGYRYGLFNGKENDTDLNGSQLIQDYGFRVYNPVIGRFLSVDPLTKSYPMLTPYQFASNSPIQAIDLDGLEGVKAIDFTWAGGIVLSKADYENVSDQISSEIHALLDPRLPSGFRVRTSYSVQYTDEGTSYVVQGKKEIVPTEVARENLFWNISGTVLIPFQFIDVAGAKNTLFSSAKNLIPLTKKTASELMSLFKTGDITRKQLKAVSYTLLRGSLNNAGKVAKVGDQAHHLFPMSVVLKNPILQKAVDLGLDFNSSRNGEFVNIFTHLGENFFNHPIYNKYADNLADGLKGLEGNKLLEGIENSIDELKSVVKEAKETGKTLDQVSELRMKNK